MAGVSPRPDSRAEKLGERRLGPEGLAQSSSLPGLCFVEGLRGSGCACFSKLRCLSQSIHCHLFRFVPEAVPSLVASAYPITQLRDSAFFSARVRFPRRQLQHPLSCELFAARGLGQIKLFALTQGLAQTKCQCLPSALNPTASPPHSVLVYTIWAHAYVCSPECTEAS